MIADVWSSFLAELVAVLVTWGILLAVLGLVGFTWGEVRYRHGRRDQARWFVADAARREVVRQRLRDAPTLPLPVRDLVPAQRRAEK